MKNCPGSKGINKELGHMGANESTSSNGINDSAFLPVTDCDSYHILKHSENPAYGQFIIAKNR